MSHLRANEQLLPLPVVKAVLCSLPHSLLLKLKRTIIMHLKYPYCPFHIEQQPTLSSLSLPAPPPNESFSLLWPVCRAAADICQLKKLPSSSALFLLLVPAAVYLYNSTLLHSLKQRAPVHQRTSRRRRKAQVFWIMQGSQG